MNNADIERIESAFYDKFGVYPYITYENVQSYGRNFLIWKQELMGGNSSILYYKLGTTVDWALWFVDLWRKQPQSIITFKDKKEIEMYRVGLELEVRNDKGDK